MQRGGGLNVTGKSIQSLKQKVKQRLPTEIPNGGITFNGEFCQSMKQCPDTYDLFLNNILTERPKKYGGTNRRTQYRNRTLRTRFRTLL
jgi:hypothetical protein